MISFMPYCAFNFLYLWRFRDAGAAYHTSYCSEAGVSHMGARIKHAVMRVLQGLPNGVTAHQYRSCR